MRFAILIVCLLLAVPAFAADSVLVVRQSRQPVKETIDTLVKTLEGKGIKAVARVDHAAGAKSAGMELLPTEVVFFGNPKLGTPLMQANPEIAIDLPMRVVAWQDKAGKVWIGYTSTAALKARYGIAGRDDVFDAMAGALDAFTKAAAE